MNRQQKAPDDVVLQRRGQKCGTKNRNMQKSYLFHGNDNTQNMNNRYWAPADIGPLEKKAIS